MDSIKANRFLDRILWSKKFITVKDNNGMDQTFILRMPNLYEKNRANSIYFDALKRGKQVGILTEMELMSHAKLDGSWSSTDEAMIKFYEESINNLQQLIDKSKGMFRKNPAKIKQIKTKIQEYEKELDDLNLKKMQVVTQHSLEFMARHQSENYLLSRAVLNIDESQVWPNQDMFNTETDITLINNLMEAYIDAQNDTQTHLRQLAKVPRWSLMWSVAKKIQEPLFGKDIKEYTNEQLMLCYWSTLYDSVYESIDRPPKNIIDNDELLDAWFEEQSQKYESERQRDYNKKGRTSNYKSSVDRHPEQFVMASNQSEAESIYNQNDSKTRNKLAKESEIIDSKGSIDEFNLRYEEYRKKAFMNANKDEMAAKRRQAYSRKGFI